MARSPSFALVTLLATPIRMAHAASFRMEFGSVIEILGLEVGSTTYDIQFRAGTYDDLYGDTVFADATAIGNAIVMVLNDNGSPTITPTGTDGGGPQSVFVIPEALNAANSVSIFGALIPNNSVEWKAESPPPVPRDVIGLWVIPQDVEAVIPLPAAFPLFATGLGLLGFVGWSKKRRSRAAQ